MFLGRICRFVLSRNIHAELILIKKNYHFSFTEKRPKAMAIYSLDGRSYTCGFADRLRGIITVYAYAKANHIPFRIDHQIPFCLEDYYIPNKYDWSYKKDEKSFNILYSGPIVMMGHTKGYRLFSLNKKRQHHFYVNIGSLSLINKRYGVNYLFHELYNELLKPSFDFQRHIDQIVSDVKEDYISVSFRFLQLMGDFQDCMGEVLGKEEREVLLQCSIDALYKIHSFHLDIPKVLVTSDSQTFIDAVKEIDFVYIIPGKIGHIGFTQGKDIHIKTFLDFYMISKAKKAYMAYSNKMYKSHFAQTAALTTGIPYEEFAF